METGSVVGAAKILNVSQPVVSRVLRHLEDQAKVPLFERAKGRLQPTAHSAILFSEVSTIFKNVRSLQESFRRMAVGEDMVFRVGASPSLAAHLVPKAMLRLRKRFPKLIMRLDVLSVSQVTDYLVFGEGEMIVGVFQQDHPSLSTQLLGSGEIVAVTPRSSDDRAGLMGFDQLAEMASADLIGFEDSTPHGRPISEYLASKGLRYEPTTIVRFAETACQMVDVGLGSAFVDSFTASGFAGRNISIRRLPNPPSMSVYVHTHLERGLSSFGRYLRNSLRSEVEEARTWLASLTA
ncbi:LysR family transcriptional regulator [Microvirga sp. VF16]|uniref:LysR family transcriptional regulator n=1 Tax=Microvirga sp. VF16 TaxID=2807101 RepID=UPI00193E8EB6|nr:LysR family transcriptional regulator [Microvirga sp. VF16]QRM33173.1 LysR family transcriptional regulator [Microvirga sp. VF16]